MLKQQTCIFFQTTFNEDHVHRKPADAAWNCLIYVSRGEGGSCRTRKKKKKKQEKKEFEKVVQQLSRGEHYEHRICRSWSRGLEILSRATDVFRCTLQDTRSIPGNVCQECREDTGGCFVAEFYTVTRRARPFRFLARRMRIVLFPECLSLYNLYGITLETIMDPVSLHSLKNT